MLLNTVEQNNEPELSVEGYDFVDDDPKITDTRSHARSLLLQAVYASLSGSQKVAKTLEQITSTQKVGTMEDLINAIANHIDREQVSINETIESHTTRNSLSSTPLVARCILTIALAEIGVRPDLSAAIIVNEAVNLAHLYCSDETAQFVNAVLRRLASCKQSSIYVK